MAAARVCAPWNIQLNYLCEDRSVIVVYSLQSDFVRQSGETNRTGVR